MAEESGIKGKPKGQAADLHIPVGYFRCPSCGHRWVGVSDLTACPVCSSGDVIGPVSISKLRRTLRLTEIDAEADDSLKASLTELRARVVSVTELALRTAEHLHRVATSDLEAETYSDPVIRRLSVCFWIFAELDMPQACAEVGHEIGMAYLDRGSQAISSLPFTTKEAATEGGLLMGYVEHVPNPDWLDLYVALEWFRFLQSKEFVALTHLRLATCAKSVSPDELGSPQRYASMLRDAVMHLEGAIHIYKDQAAKEQVAIVQEYLDRTDALLNSVVGAWGAEASGKLQKEGMIEQAEILADSISQLGREHRIGMETIAASITRHGLSIGEAIEAGAARLAAAHRRGMEEVGSGVRDAGSIMARGTAWGLNSLGKQVREGIQNHGSIVGAGLGSLALGVGAGMLGGSVLGGALVRSGLKSIGPSVAGAIQSGMAQVGSQMHALADGEDSVVHPIEYVQNIIVGGET